MSRVIYKYLLDLNDLHADSSLTLRLPVGSSALYATKQRGTIVLYAEVDPAAELTDRKVYVYGTGQPLNCSSRAEPMGVVSLNDGTLMFHVYIEPENVETICTCGNPSRSVLLTDPPKCKDCGKGFS